MRAGPRPWVTTKKRTMEHTALIAIALIIPIRNDESRSALPNAPVVDDGRARRRGRLATARAWLATALHRAAWAVEPDPWTTARAHPARSSAETAYC